ncbi:MAG: phosphotransferase [Planctomycetes bacterium]|nr:phosphotransferase [Planctomycetota bacterium]
MVNDLAHQLLSGDFKLLELSPEASPRRYFRVALQNKLLVSSEQPPATDCQDILSKCGIATPKYFNAVEGGYLIEDCGDQHLSNEPSTANYQALIDDWFTFSRVQLASSHPNFALALDTELFTHELRQFVNCYLIEYLQCELSQTQLEHLHQLCAHLAADAGAGPQCLQHRDFHCRNIMLHPKHPQPLWIDFQDMRRGPIFYDLASLFTDAYLDLGDDIFKLINAAVMRLGNEHAMHHDDCHPQFLVTALQRVLKALGTFGFLINNGRSEYRDAARRATICALGLLDQLPEYYDLRQHLS